MFRRHWKSAQLRQQDMRAKEDKLRQDAFLEQVYKQRMAEKERNGDAETDDDEMDWDPIENFLEDSRGSYVGMSLFSRGIISDLLLTSGTLRT